MLKFDKPTLVTITAPTCSGKNFLRDTLEHRLGFNRIVSTTTRAMRSGELEGLDYYFIDQEKSLRMERLGVFAELVEFRGARYGVSKFEMGRKMDNSQDSSSPMVILEPKGLELYRAICVHHDWDIFTIYVHTVESLRLERLLRRTLDDYTACNTACSGLGRAPNETKEQIIKTHIDRTISITGDERAWSNSCIWNAIVPGDDIEKAVKMIELGIVNRNQRNKEPAAFML